LPWDTLGAEGLVHGDYGGRNILVDAAARTVVAVVDWEYASAGCALWDIGSLFRYAKRYDDAFRAAFARGYRAAGGELATDWFQIARLVDAGHQLSDLLEGEAERPYFDEIRELLARVAAAVR
jgi:thiamine kinase-like enzyme